MCKPRLNFAHLGLHTVRLVENIELVWFGIQEVWRIAACPSREDLIATLHSDSTGRAGGRQSTLWRLTGVGEDAASGALRPLEQLATLSDDDSESHGRGKQLGSTVWSPEGPHAVATTEGRRICIWSLQESDPSVAKLSGRASAPGTISACCWGGPPGSARLLSSSNGDIHTWDARALGGSPTTVAIARAHGGSAVLSLDCNPLKPHQVLSAGGDLLLKCWDVRKATEPLLTLPGHSHWATNARYNPSHDQLVLSASTDHTVRHSHGPFSAANHSSQVWHAFCGRSVSGESRPFRWSRWVVLLLQKTNTRKGPRSRTMACGCLARHEPSPLPRARLFPICLHAKFGTVGTLKQMLQTYDSAGRL